MIEVQYEDGQAVFIAQADQNAGQVVPLPAPDSGQIIVPLSPPGTPGKDRLKAHFTVDDQRQLRLTVTDLLTKKILLHNTVAARLR